MDKMAILAAITTEPSISLHQRPDLLPNLWPSEVRPQQGNLLNGASFFVVLRTYFAASVAVKSMARLGGKHDQLAVLDDLEHGVHTASKEEGRSALPAQ
ncbi:hypothetical protein P8C59_005524 [Phyllachora maydis]|uniref:Uncharacterized protein n=1 Tax=Phyllachora maydis TaxID=1825666 RepID=A0AAD9MFK6_9PEZI|nr:hypothetical protein P8C59_005524 [Phyllachora maydis]